MHDETKKKFIILDIFLLGLLITIPAVNELIPQNVTVEIHSIQSTEIAKFKTTRHQVFEFFEDHRDRFGEHDLILLDQSTFIKNGMKLTVLKGTKSTAMIKGREQEFYLYEGTVGDNLTFNEINFDSDDIIKPRKNKKVKPDTRITFKQVDYKKREKTEEVAPKEKDAVFDNRLASGVIERSKGEPGKAVFEYSTKYVDGKKAGTKKKVKVWIKKPVDIVMRFGTKETGETGKAKYSDTFTGECTAYYAGTHATGAIGERVRYGTCAVDPTVIPYGTKLYVEGYGTAVANDCGGAVKGHILDLYMHSTRECIQWGRRNKKVYILKK